MFSEPLKYLLILGVVVLVFALRYHYRRFENEIEVLSQWREHLVNFRFSVQEYFETVREITSEKAIPGLKIKRVKFYEKQWPSRRRYYLKIEKDNLVFYVYAFPLGRDFFIGYYHGIKKYQKEDIEVRKTFYQAEVEKAIKDSIHACIVKSIEVITKHYGFRLANNNS